MAKGIDHFDRGAFEAALPAGLWQALGLIDGEYCYLVRPFPANPFGLFVRSSVHGDGRSAECGEDSIRAWIVQADSLKAHGGKSQRWVSRVKGWQGRLTVMLRKLAGQVRWLLPCPHCGQTLVPFTAKKGKKENKDRGFVKCDNERCPGRPADRPDPCGFFAWCDDENLEPVAPPAELKDGGPKCPECGGGTVRLSSGKGWRCRKAGRWDPDARAWTGCPGVVWDEPFAVGKAPGRPSKATVAVEPGDLPTARVKPAVERQSPAKGKGPLADLLTRAADTIEHLCMEAGAEWNADTARLVEALRDASEK